MSSNSRWPSIGAFLKEQRKLIPRETAALGPYLREPSRRGKPVTQEEIAEVIGVSRVWYAMLESGAGLRTSPRLVARLADALALTDGDREALLKLGVPELSGNRSLSLQDLSAIASLRNTARRVWSATSESEILRILVEAVANRFRDCDCAGALVRVKPGQWENPANYRTKRIQKPLADMYAELYSGLFPAQIDELNFYGVLNDPGQVGSRFELFSGLTHSMRDRYEKACSNAGLQGANFIKTCVKSRDGFEATICVGYGYGDEVFSELDRAFMGGLADFASLAAFRGS